MVASFSAFLLPAEENMQRCSFCVCVMQFSYELGLVFFKVDLSSCFPPPYFLIFLFASNIHITNINFIHVLPHVLIDISKRKKGDLTQSYDKTPYTNRKFENQTTTHKRHQKLRLHNDCGPT